MKRSIRKVLVPSIMSGILATGSLSTVYAVDGYGEVNKAGTTGISDVTLVVEGSDTPIPIDPDKPDKPDEPDKPDKPDTPDEPDTPDNPGGSHSRPNRPKPKPDTSDTNNGDTGTDIPDNKTPTTSDPGTPVPIPDTSDKNTDNTKKQDDSTNIDDNKSPLISDPGIKNTGSLSAGDSPILFSAYVPVELPISVDESGAIQTCEDAMIVNGVETKGIKVSNIKTRLDIGWRAADWNDDFKSKALDTQELALKLRNDTLHTDGSFDINEKDWYIPKNSYIELGMEAQLPSQSINIDRENIAEVEFTLDWSGDNLTTGPEIPAGLIIGASPTIAQ